jgi:hypothetical protein
LIIKKECKKLYNEVSNIIDAEKNNDDIKMNYWTGKTWDKLYRKICDFLKEKQNQIW